MLPVVNAISYYNETQYFEIWLSELEEHSGEDVDKLQRLVMMGQYPESICSVLAGTRRAKSGMSSPGDCSVINRNRRYCRYCKF